LTSSDEAVLPRLVPRLVAMNQDLPSRLDDGERQAFMHLRRKFVQLNSDQSRAPGWFAVTTGRRPVPAVLLAVALSPIGPRPWIPSHPVSAAMPSCNSCYRLTANKLRACVEWVRSARDAQSRRELVGPAANSVRTT
jgi:hypothetical protein